MKRMSYVDGLKGWCAISACLAHFLLTFIINGFVGWRCLPEAAAQPAEYYFKWFPYSIATNNSFPLYIFFALISFIICYLFFKKQDENKLKQQAVLRYFRFLPLVLITCVAAYLLITFGLCQFREFYDITGNTWIYARAEETYSFPDVLRIGFFDAYFKGTQLVSPLWCMHYIFLGSMLTYVTMLLYNRINNKIAFFAFLILLFYFADSNYLAFIAGIIAAIIANREYKMKKIYGALIVLAGCVFGLFPPVLIPPFIGINTFYAIGALLVIAGTHSCFADNRLLCGRFIGFLGRESLGLIIWHFLVLQSLNIFLYIYLRELGMSEALNIAINFVANTGVTLLVTWVSSKTVTPLTTCLCKKVGALLCKR